MKYLVCCFLLMLTACFNKAEVPKTVETCFKNTKTGECTNDIQVTHTVVIELPVALVNDCQERFKHMPEPDRTLNTQACVTEYISSLLDLIKGITPADIPVLP